MQYQQNLYEQLSPKCILSLGFSSCAEFDAGLLVPEQRIRDLCINNRCGNYNTHYMCPPYSGPLSQIKAQLRVHKRGIILQYSKPLDIEHDKAGLKRTKREFHEMILQLDSCLVYKGIKQIWALIGGSFELCETCYL